MLLAPRVLTASFLAAHLLSPPPGQEASIANATSMNAPPANVFMSPIRAAKSAMLDGLPGAPGAPQANASSMSKGPDGSRGFGMGRGRPVV